MAKQQFISVRGMYDVLPEQASRVDYLYRLVDRLALAAGYGRIEPPIVESAQVFVRGVGEGTDIVDKELYRFDDKSGNSLSLRPEYTAGVVRAYIENGMGSRPQPVKLFYYGPVFRYDRPQAGRQRQFSQVGVEVYGEPNSSMDAQVIMLARRIYHGLGLRNVSLQINSLGDASCRPKYKKALVDYLEVNSKQLCEVCRERLKSNPMRVLDCKEERCQIIISEAPQILNFLCAGCQAHLTGVLEYLDELDVAYDLNPMMVRGLDYYNRTVFEFYGEREGAQSSLGGGGRYDALVEQLGGAPTPAVGFGLGVERILMELESSGIELLTKSAPAIYVASLGEPARLAAFRLIEAMLDGGVAASGAVDKDGIGAQLARANKLGVPYTVIIGQKEVMEETVILRDMVSGAQEMIPIKKIVAELKTRFNGIS